jgi:hypothetical protein
MESEEWKNLHPRDLDFARRTSKYWSGETNEGEFEFGAMSSFWREWNIDSRLNRGRKYLNKPPV